MKTYGVNGKKNIIGEKVKKLRKAQRWSQNDLAIRSIKGANGGSEGDQPY